MTELMLRIVAAIGAGGASFVVVRGLLAPTAAGDITRRLGGIEVAQPPGHAVGESVRRAPRGDSRWLHGRVGRALKRDLQRAGVGWETRDYVVIIGCMAMVMGLLGWTLARSAWITAALALLGGTIPVALMKRAMARRASALNAQVVDLIEMIASSLRSGFGFAQSLELGAGDQADPLASELRLLLREMSLGVSTDDALERMVLRTGDEDLSLVVTAVTIQRRVGGNLAEVLENIGQMIRDRARVRGEIRTLTAQARLSALIVGLLPVGLALVIGVVQPDYLAVLITDPRGRIMAAFAAILEAVGFFIVRRIGATNY